jgi:hypothetical protein
VQQARQALADRLREIRVDAGHSAKSLALAAGWHNGTKVSKIEHAKQTPTVADIGVWCELCGVADQGPELVASLRAVQGMFIEWRRMERTGLKLAQESVRAKWERTRHFRAYSPSLIPGVLQTRAYTEAVLNAVMIRRGLPDDVADAVAVRMERQHVLYEGDHRFAILIEESALRAGVGGSEVMAGQLDHLITCSSLPSVSLGVIPPRSDRRTWPVEGFWIFDEEQVNVELVSGYLTVTQPHEIELYTQSFAELWDLALTGTPARQLIMNAVGDLRLFRAFSSIPLASEARGYLASVVTGSAYGDGAAEWCTRM